MSRTRLCLLGVGSGTAYGVLLLFVAALLSGGGEGFTISFAVFSSPFSATPLFALFPLPWTILGGLLAAGYLRTARVWLLIHAAAIPVAIHRTLAAFGMTFDEWFRGLVNARIHPIVIAMWSIYACCYFGAWWLTWRNSR